MYARALTQKHTPARSPVRTRPHRRSSPVNRQSPELRHLRDMHAVTAHAVNDVTLLLP